MDLNRDERDKLDRLELELMAARRLEELSRDDEAEWPALLIRHGQDQGDRQHALNHFQRMVSGLRARGIPGEVKTLHVPEGSQFTLTIEETS